MHCSWSDPIAKAIRIFLQPPSCFGFELQKLYGSVVFIKISTRLRSRANSPAVPYDIAGFVHGEAWLQGKNIKDYFVYCLDNKFLLYNLENNIY